MKHEPDQSYTKDWTLSDVLIGNKGYDAEERVIDRLGAANIQPVIPPKSNRKNPRDYDKALYKARHLIENCFEKLKNYRAIATRYDKTRNRIPQRNIPRCISDMAQMMTPPRQNLYALLPYLR